MANEEQLAILRQGVQVWNKWRDENYDVIIDLFELELSNMDLSGINLIGADMGGAKLFNINLSNANLNFSEISHSNMNDVKLIGASLVKSRLISTHMKDVDLSNADLNGANLQNSHLESIKLNGTILIGVDLTKSKLNFSPLKNTDLSGAYLSGAELSGMILNSVNLSNARLDGANLSNARLDGANLSNARLYGANLSRARLDGAILIDADLTNVVLKGSDLSNADLSRVNLVRAYLGEARMHKSNVSSARMNDTVFVNNDLSMVQGLDTIIHLGPSVLDVGTLVKLGSKIPENFLRGCGVPESFIEYLPSLIGAIQPIQFFKCFLSHSTKDHDFAQRLYDRMQGQGIRVWFAPEELKGGRLLDEQIDHAIRLHDKLILVLSDESVRSKWVMKEIRKARREELANNRRKLFPIRLTDMQTLEHWECLDPETGHDLADVVRSYFIPDFSNWKDHDAFERAFTKFLDALKAVDEPPVDGQDHEKRLAFLRRQLSAKEIAKAKFGLHVPTHIELEIEDLKQEIARLEGQITE